MRTDGSLDVGSPPEFAGQPVGSTLHGVPSFNALHEICAKYMDEHWLRSRQPGAFVCGGCKVQFDDRAAFHAHVAELTASHLAFAIQLARNS